MCNSQLVAKRDDLQMQCRARTNQEPKRAEDRNDDGHDKSSLLGTRTTSLVTRRTAFPVGTASQSESPFRTKLEAAQFYWDFFVVLRNKLTDG